jgi:ankyrin repeat protein
MSASKRLLSKSVGSEPLNGDSFLHKYARANSATVIVENACKCDVNIKNNRLETPLITAAQHSACRVVAKLVQLGAKVNERDNQGNTALHYAVLNASEKTVVILSMSGTDVTIQNSDSQTVIHLLVFSHDNNIPSVMSFGNFFKR